MASQIKYLSLEGLARIVAYIRAKFGTKLSYSPNATNGTLYLLSDVIDDTTATYGVISTITIPTVSATEAGLITPSQAAKLNELADEQITSVGAGNGLIGGGSSGDLTLNVGAGTGISVAADKVNLKTATSTEIGGIKIGYPESGKNYPVELNSSGQAYVNVPWVNTTTLTINATASDDDIVVLTGTGGNNSVSYGVSHAKMFGASTPTTTNKYTSGNTTTSISGSAASGTIKIPQLTVDEYGHVKAASDESIEIKMPAIPTTLKSPKALSITVGNNAAVSYDGGTAKSVVITPETIGIPNVMQYAGQTATTQTLADGSATAAITLTTGSYTAKRGDVVIDSSNSREYIWNGSKWELFGVDNISSYKLKQTAVSDPTASGTANAFIDTISQDANGNITVTKKNVTPLSTATAESTATDAIVLGDLSVDNHTITMKQKTIVAGSNITIGTSTTGKIYISGKPDTKVTSVVNHYTPSTASNTTKSASSSTPTDITNSSSGVNVVTGVNIDAAGHLTGVTSVTLKSTNTDTKVTSVANHYTPSTASNTTKSASSSTPTDITNSSSGVNVVTGVNIDAAGHLTGVTSVTLKSTNTNTHNTSLNIVGTSSTATANGAVTGNGVYLNHTENGTKTSSHKITGTGSCKVTSDASGNITIYADTNTHHQAKNVLTSTNNGTTAAAATSPYLNLVENGTVRSAIQIVGAGGTTVSSSADGKLTITSETHVAITNGEIDALFGITD